MKIRWSEGSVRFRIRPDELEKLQEGGTFRETLELPAGPTWSAVISASGAKERSALTWDSATLYLHLTDADIARLADTSQEGVYFDEGDALRYYIEKDFPCAHPRASEASEKPTATFPPTPTFEARKVSFKE